MTKPKQQAPTPAASAPIAPGDWTEVEGMRGVVARVETVDARRKRARVQVGGQQWDVDMRRLKRAQAPAEDHARPGGVGPAGGLIHVSGSDPTYASVDLHGLRVEEALDAAERGLDQAVVNGLPSFKIVHGHGTGSVRRAVRKMLDTHPHVESYRFGNPIDGGLGCTIVFFRHGA